MQKNLQININHPSALYSIVRYARVDNTSSPSYITISNVPNGVFTIQNIPNGQYRVGITPVYSDGRVCTETFQDTSPCGGVISFSAILSGGNIQVGYTINVNVPNFQVNINYPNGGTFSQQYVNGGSGTVNVTPPSGLYGNYSVNIQPVCDTDTGFLGTPTAPAIVTVPAPNNSTLTNDSSGALAPLSLTAYASGSQLIFTSPSVAGSGGSVNFYLADDNYTSLVLNYGSGSPVSASLTTGSGTYTGVLTSGVITFNNVVASGGVTITIS